jgi:hypothetical protein
MNTQEIITPIGKAMEWSFENILVPMADPLNLGVVILGLVGLVYWLRLQKKYNDQAKSDGTIA